ncbi:MAG: hypothetical protein AB9869_08865 [Verrucomicrobiia bacterium]
MIKIHPRQECRIDAMRFRELLILILLVLVLLLSQTLDDFG